MGSIQRYQLSSSGKGQSSTVSESCSAHCTLNDLFDLLDYQPSRPVPEEIVSEFRFMRMRVRAGKALYRMNQPFNAVYVIRLGQMKTVLHGLDGDERILYFPMKGDFLGFDGIYLERYATDAVALTDTELLVLPYRQLLVLGGRFLEFAGVIYKAASREMNRGRETESLQCSLKAEARVAWFIESQAQRCEAQGFSPSCFVLPMTRRDIGNYLGVSLETVSRAISTLSAQGIISVNRRSIKINKPEALHGFRPVKAGTTPLVLPRLFE